MVTKVNIHEAEEHFTKLLRLVLSGEKFIIANEGDIANGKIYNIGNNKSVRLMDFIEAIETTLGMKAQKEMLPMQPGDVERTWADVTDLIQDYDYRPHTPIQEGVEKFVEWYRNFYTK